MKNRSSDCKKILIKGRKGGSLFCGSQREKVASLSLVITVWWCHSLLVVRKERIWNQKGSKCYGIIQRLDIPSQSSYNII